jgi:hypothetical protein
MSNGASRRRPLGVHALLITVFIVVHMTALAHEFEHVLHQHDAPCGLHVVADHLAMAPAPEPALAVGPAPAAGTVPTVAQTLFPSASRPGDARAPPLPVLA